MKSSTGGEDSFSLLASYIPQDRRQVLAEQKQCSPHPTGAALFADISGFTQLTETLKLAFGPRLGVEKLATQLNLVYDAIIAEVDRYGGSVLGFSGDAITCWFDQGEREAPSTARAEFRATACAFALHQALQQVEIMPIPGYEQQSLSIKVAIASGDVHRYLVGDPAIQVIDAAAGSTLERMAAAEKLANRGEVVVDEPTALLLGENLEIVEWRSPATYHSNDKTGAPDEPTPRFVVAAALHTPAAYQPWTVISSLALPTAELRPWLLPAIFERLNSGQGEFLTELRPAVALFLRFGGIDFDHDPQAGEKLNHYISWLQGVVRRYDGALIQLTIGEKGSYLYIAYGAPVTHEDDAWRAASTALELRSPPKDLAFITPIQIGISQGTMRTGSYGSRTRRTYGVLGDDVNLAARLMQIASNGQILVSEQIRKALSETYTFQPLAAVQLKGKRTPVPVSLLLEKTATLSSARRFSGNLVGRQEELQSLLQATAPIFAEPARFAGVTILDGEAGTGKSRLAHALQQALQDGRHHQWFTCPSEPILHQSLYPFKYFLRQYFKQDTRLPEEENKQRFNSVLDALSNALRQNTASDPRCTILSSQIERTRSVLGALVDLHWPGSLYERLEPKLRFENTLLAFKSLLLAEALQKPVILHIEDAHSLDDDSLSMLQNILRGVEDIPLLLLLCGRYCDANDPDCQSLTSNLKAPQQHIHLKELSLNETSALAAQAVASYTNSAMTLSAELSLFLMQKTNGNPSFVEQLALDLCERNLIRAHNDAWVIADKGVEGLPASISAVMIARLDRLDSPLRAVVQTAAVLGAEFEPPVLEGMIPDEPELPRRMLDGLELGIWLPNEERLMFRQSTLRDAAYDMQPQSRLQELHARAAAGIEVFHSADLPAHYVDLAYHHELAGHLQAAFDYSRHAGERAAAQYAIQQAAENFKRALQLAEQLPQDQVRTDKLAALLAFGELLVSAGQYRPDDAWLDQALALAAELNDARAQGRACRWLARYSEMRSDYPQSLAWVQRGLQALGNLEAPETCDLLSHAGLVYTRLGNPAEAQSAAEHSLAIAQRLNDLRALGRANTLLGHIARLRGETQAAIHFLQRSVDYHNQAGDNYNLALAQNQLAIALWNISRWQEAGQQFTQARQTFDQIGDLYHRAFIDNNLGDLKLNQGQVEEALHYFQQGLSAAEQSGGSTWVLGGFHSNLGAAHIRRGDAQAALRHLETSQRYFEQSQARDWLPELNRHQAEAYLLLGELDTAEAHASQALTTAGELKQAKEEGGSLRLLGQIALGRGDFEAAHTHLTHSLEKLASHDLERARTWLALARLRAAHGKSTAMRAALQECIPIFETLGAELDLIEARSLTET